MGHLGVSKSKVYEYLAKRLDQNPVGAPLNETLMKILYTMYTEKEAEIGSQFPQGFTTVEKLAHKTGLPTAELVNHLENMAQKGLIIDVPRQNTALYMLSPLVIGFFEYSFMRVTDKLPLKDLAELYEAYHRDKRVPDEFFGAETKMFHTLAYESLLPEDVETEVLTYELASEIIRDSGGGALSMCYCRHQAMHLGKVCDAPIEDVCTSLGRAAEWLIRRGFARPASVDELLRVLEKTEAMGLVHLGDNVQNNPAYICHCCGCCCGALRAINEHEILGVQPSNFIPQVTLENCIGCEACSKRCHVKAIDILEDVAGNPQNKKIKINSARCIGCGACIRGCKKSALKLVRREEIYIPPQDKKEQMLRIAREKGKLNGV